MKQLISRARVIFTGRFFYLLCCQFLLFTLYPFLNYSNKGGVLIIEALYVAILLASVRVVIHDRGSLKIMVFLLLLASIIIRTLDVYLFNVFLYASGLIIDMLFYTIITIVIINYVVKSGRVTTDKILGAICVYIFIGILFTQVFSMIELIEPGSFDMALHLADPSATEEITARSSIFFYFSFVTLTTVGYGDVVPTTQPGASFAVMEAIIGQIYLTVLIARLVGLHIAYARVSSDDD